MSTGRTMEGTSQILIADDEMEFVESVKGLLGSAGHQCHQAGDGQQVQQLLQSHDFDLVLLDYRMPGNENLECLQYIARSYPEIPVMLVTGYPSLPSAVESLKLRVFDYVTKPFDPAYFKRRVAEAVEWKRLRRALRESEAHYRDLFEGIADAVLVHDHAGKILDVNEASCAGFGYSRAELIGMNIGNLVAPESHTTWGDLASASKAAQPAPFEIELRTRDGRTIPCEIRQLPVQHDGRQVLQSVARDITARKIAEEYLQWRNRELAACYAVARTVSESLDLDHIFAHALAETLQVVEAQMGALFLLEDDTQPLTVAHQGLSEEFIKAVEHERGLPVDSFSKNLGPARVGTIEDLSCLPEAIRDAARCQAIGSMLIIPIESRGFAQGLLLIAYDRPRPLQEREAAMLEVIGKEIGVALENGRLYSAVMDSERRYRQLFEGIVDPVLMHDFAGRIQAVNPAACLLLGFTEEELLLQDLRRIGGERYAKEVRSRALEADGQGRLPLFESDLRTRSGHICEVEVHARIVSGPRPSVLSVLRDITERKFEARRAALAGAIRAALGHCPSAREYLNEVLRAVADFTGCACVGVRMLDSRGKAPYVAQIGLTEEFAHLEGEIDPRDGRCPCAHVLCNVQASTEGERSEGIEARRRGGLSDHMTEGGSFFCSDATACFGGAEERAVALPDSACLGMPFNSVAIVPIRRGSEVVGLIHVADRESGKTKASVAVVLEEIATVVGSALRQYDLEESLAWEIRQTEVGFGLTSGILAGKPLEEAVSQVLGQIADLTGFEILAVERFRPEQDALEMWLYHYPGSETERHEWVVPCDQTLSGRVAKSGEVVEELNIEPDSTQIHPALRGLNIRKIVGFPIRHHERIIGVLSVASSGAARPRSQIVKFLGAIADQLALVTSWTDAQVELNRSRRELRSLSAQLIRALEDERARIARELHDSLGQILTSITIDFDRHVAHLAPETVREAELLPRLRAHLGEAHATVRQLTASLRPGILDDLGLVAALESCVEEFEQRTGIACCFENPIDPLALDLDSSVALYRVAQEALTNAARHAHPQHIQVGLAPDAEKQIVLCVRDDGCGFDLSQLDWQTCFGLLGMRERLQLVGGQLRIVTQPGAGTAIHASVPMRRS